MELGFLLTISCVMTAISMLLFVGIIAYFARFGGQGVKMLIDRFTGGVANNNKQDDPVVRRGQTQQPTMASSQSMRQRVSNLDFPAPAQASASGGQFGAQIAGQSANNPYSDFPPPKFQQPQQASLTPRYPEFNPQASQAGQTQGFQANTPSLSPSRPFQAGSQFNRNTQATQPYGQQANQFGAQSAQQNNQFGQPPQQFGQQQSFGPTLQGNQYNQQQAPPPPRAPQQQFGQPQQNNQFGQQAQQFGQQQGFNAQGFNQQPNPQQGGLSQNLPPLRSLPRPGNTQYDRPIGRRDRRQGDDRDYIYDDQGNRGIVDDVGDFIDNF